MAVILSRRVGGGWLAHYSLKEQGPVQSRGQVRLGASGGHDGDPVAEDAPDPGGVRRRAGYHHDRLHVVGE
jgi:hypothetical protein